MAHDHDPMAARLGERARTLVIALTAALATATLVGLIVLWPADRPPGEGSVPEREGVVEQIVAGPCASGQGECELIETRLDDGRLARFEHAVGFGRLDFDVGDPIVVNEFAGEDGEPVYLFLDFQRTTPLLVLAAVFVVAVVALGRWRGLGALAGLVASLVVLGVFVLPALSQGRPPLPVALTGGIAVAIVALLFAHGVSIRTVVALLGTVGALVLTVVLAVVFIGASRITGTTDEFAQVIALPDGVGLDGLVLAGIVIGALGVLDDVTVTQVSAVWELRAANPSSGPLALWRAGLRIGRDHVSSTVNTLVLAYTGASLPLLLLFTQTGQGWRSVVTQELVAVEVVRALIGSLGLVAAVPLTTGLAALLVCVPEPGPRASESLL